MRIVFAGTPDFARTALEAICAAGHEVALVLTQPDRPAGRGLKMRPSAVKQAALDAGLPILQPRSLRLDGRFPEDAQMAQQALQKVQPDLMVVVAYGLLLPAWVLQLPVHGCFNIHASLLPRWRGAAPIQRAIEAGDSHTGITIMQMDEGLDTGPMLLQHRLPIAVDDSAAHVHDTLAQLGARSILEAIQLLEQGRLNALPQPDEGVTYAAKLQKSEAALDLSLPARVLVRRIRAFDPVPGATLRLPGLSQPVKIWSALALEVHGHAGVPGDIVQVNENGIDVLTADGVLRILELQQAGSKRQPVGQFVRGTRLDSAGRAA